MDVVFLSDKGKVRETNEDSCFYEKIDEDVELLVVADGMGGHNAGEIASKIAIETIKNYINIKYDKDRKNIDFLLNLLKESIIEANSKIYYKSIDNINYSGMGTTLTATIVWSNKMLIGHVGDSRAYIVRKDSLLKITNDHSLVAELVRKGSISEQEAREHPQRNIIMRALGTSKDIDVDMITFEIIQYDKILLCTDGLTNMLSDSEIINIIKSAKNIEEAIQNLIIIANDIGGIDNITVILACYNNCEVKS